MKEEFKRYLTQCCAGYKAGLKDDILPFWMKYGYDRDPSFLDEIRL